MDTSSKTRNDSDGLNRPITTIAGDIEAPYIKACLNIETASFLRLSEKAQCGKYTEHQMLFKLS